MYYHLRLFLLLLFPRLEKEINWAKNHEPLEQELRRLVPESEVGVRFADAMIKVVLHSGDERILHGEVQAQPQEDFGRRVFGYNYRGYDRFGSHPESLIVLGDADPKWKPTKYKVKLEYTTMTFTFAPVKLLTFAARRKQLLASDNPMGLFVLAHLDAQRTTGDLEAAEAAKLALLSNLAARKLEAGEKRMWIRYLDYFFSDLPAEASARIDRKVAELLQEQDMSFANYVTTTERRGIALGKSEGLRQGRLEALELALRFKFGEAGIALLPDFAPIDDPEQLRVVVQSVQAAASLDEVRKLVPSPTMPTNGTTSN